MPQCLNCKINRSVNKMCAHEKVIDKNISFVLFCPNRVFFQSIFAHQRSYELRKKRGCNINYYAMFWQAHQINNIH